MLILYTLKETALNQLRSKTCIEFARKLFTDWRRRSIMICGKIVSDILMTQCLQKCPVYRTGTNQWVNISEVSVLQHIQQKINNIYKK